jgi:hypothetical protein
MPDKPDVASHPLFTQFGKVDQIMASVDLADHSYGVAYLDVPDGAPKDVEKRLDGARDGAVKGMSIDGNKATLRSEKHITVSGYPAREIVVEISVINFIGVMRLVSVNNRAYSLIFAGYSGSEVTGDVYRFLDSFAVLQP